MDVLDLPDIAAWEDWLAVHHEEHRAVWLRIARQLSGLDTIPITDARDGALCYGWIDGQRKSLDDVSFLQRYSRRRPGSSWSLVNVARVEALSAAGRMRPAGLAEVAAARSDGRWAAAYAPQRDAVVPADLEAALAADARARSAFAALGRTGRYAVILPLLKARTPAVRARILARAVEQLASSTGPYSRASRSSVSGNGSCVTNRPVNSPRSA